MIYFCADDYSLCEISSLRIKKCADDGILNKVSVFPNFDKVDLSDIAKKVRVSLHINLVEGRCMGKAEENNLLTDEKGNFRHTFVGLYKLSLFHGKKFEDEVYKEIKAQVLYWKSILPDGAPFSLDSHQHTHMIPLVFKALMRVLKDERIAPQYIRIPAEPLLPYIKTPSLYFTYSPVNLVKQWLLKILWAIDKRYIDEDNFPAAYFFGVLFSGNMDENRVSKILPHYIKMAEKNKKDIEVLFHPGYLNKEETELKEKNIAFHKFYFDKGRKTEFDAVMKISLKEV